MWEPAKQRPLWVAPTWPPVCPCHRLFVTSGLRVELYSDAPTHFRQIIPRVLCSIIYFTVCKSADRLQLTVKRTGSPTLSLTPTSTPISLAQDGVCRPLNTHWCLFVCLSGETAAVRSAQTRGWRDDSRFGLRHQRPSVPENLHEPPWKRQVSEYTCICVSVCVCVWGRENCYLHLYFMCTHACRSIIVLSGWWERLRCESTLETTNILFLCMRVGWGRETFHFLTRLSFLFKEVLFIGQNIKKWKNRIFDMDS